MVEVDAVENLVENAKFERSGGTVPQLTKTGKNRAANLKPGEILAPIFKIFGVCATKEAIQ